MTETNNTPTPPPTEWESWEEKFAQMPRYAVGDMDDVFINRADALTLMRQALAEQKACMVEVVEEERVDENFNSSWHRENAKGYNQALDDIIKALYK